MDERFFAQVVAELKSAQADALALVVAAMSQQLDAERLATDLRAQLAAAKLTRAVSPLAIDAATVALAAVDAETALRRKETH